MKFKLDMLQIGKLILHLTLSIIVLIGSVMVTVTTWALLQGVHPLAAFCAACTVFVTTRAGNKAFVAETAKLLFGDLDATE